MLILTIIFYFCIIFIGPKNLNAKKKSKGKVIEVEESEEIVNVRGYEEDIQNVNDEMILQDDEDNNFIHLDYADDFD